MAESDTERLQRARLKCDKENLFMLRAIVSGWLNTDEVTIIGAPSFARQILGALDALAIVHSEEEAARWTDEVMAKVHALEEAGDQVNGA